jgi:hypothetical protein
MTFTAQRPVNAGAIRWTYLEGLNAATQARAGELREPLTEYVRELIPAVQGRMPYISPRRRAQADHCLTRAAETLEQSPVPGLMLTHTYDLAVSARALLVLYRRPGDPD